MSHLRNEMAFLLGLNCSGEEMSSKVKLETMLNLGPKSSGWLAQIGVHTRQDLVEMGIVPAYCLLKGQGFPVSLNLLYALYGTLHDMPWNKVPPEIKEQLQADVEAFRFG